VTPALGHHPNCQDSFFEAAEAFQCTNALDVGDVDNVIILVAKWPGSRRKEGFAT
jgi:hypothetical protein